jgi:transcriptional regulator with XRE-family HTH domain
MAQAALKDASNTVNTVKKERTNMKNARIAVHLSQVQVAEQMDVMECTYVGWEKAHRKPRLYQIEKLRDILKFTGSDDDLLKVFTIKEPAKKEETDMELSRRQTLQALGITFIPGTATLSVPIVGPDEYLAQCEATIDTCWSLLNHGDFSKVEKSLRANMSTLEQYANTKSELQKKAAGLAVQAKILQINLATHKLNFAAREEFVEEAVNFGRISGNRDILASALEWQGNTYVYCYRQPERAIPIFNDALSYLGSDALLNKSKIYIYLAIAYAQVKDETNAKKNEKLAQDYAKLARDTLPEHPELDPLYQCIDLGPSELDQLEGRMYLALAEKLSNTQHARNAYDVFEKATSKQNIANRWLAQTLILKADAARSLNKMQEFEIALRSALDIAIKINSRKRMSEIHDVIGRIPLSWQGETLIQTLREDISQSPVIVRR